jgi:hypothetical protein
MFLIIIDCVIFQLHNKYFSYKYFLLLFFFQEVQAKRKQELLEKKAESKALLDQELKSIQTSGKQPLAKITQAQIQVMYKRFITKLNKSVLYCMTLVW